MVDFERWSYKKAATVEKRTRELYKTYSWMLQDAIKEGARKLSIYSTDADGTNAKLIKTITVSELL
jgi:hypothetical protein